MGVNSAQLEPWHARDRLVRQQEAGQEGKQAVRKKRKGGPTSEEEASSGSELSGHEEGRDEPGHVPLMGSRAVRACRLKESRTDPGFYEPQLWVEQEDQGQAANRYWAQAKKVQAGLRLQVELPKLELPALNGGASRAGGLPDLSCLAG